jgi:hypothetical protein
MLEVIEDRSERASTLIASQLPPTRGTRRLAIPPSPMQSVVG